MSKSSEIWYMFLDFTQRIHLGLFLIFFQLKEQKTLFAKNHKVIYLSIHRVSEKIGCHNVRILLELILQKTLYLLSLEGAVYLGMGLKNSCWVLWRQHTQKILLQISVVSDFHDFLWHQHYCAKSKGKPNKTSSLSFLVVCPLNVLWWYSIRGSNWNIFSWMHDYSQITLS